MIHRFAQTPGSIFCLKNKSQVDRFADVKIIVSHGGGYIPFVNGRVDMFFGLETLAKFDIPQLPSDYFSRLYYDAIVYDHAALQLVIDVAGPDKVMFGTDLPMPSCKAAWS